MKSKTCGFDKEKRSKNCYADNSKKLGGELEKIKGERTVKKWMSKAAGCLSLAAMLMLSVLLSRMLSQPSISMTKRSRPKAMPPCGGAALER